MASRRGYRARSCGFRAIAATIGLLIAADVPLRVFAQTPAGQSGVTTPNDAELVRVARERAQQAFGEDTSGWIVSKLSDGRIAITARDGSKAAVARADTRGAIEVVLGDPLVVPGRPLLQAGGAVGLQPANAGTTGQTPDPESTALNAELEADLRAAYQQLVVQAKALQGTRNINDVVIPDGTLVYAILTRNLYLFQLSMHAGRLVQLAAQTREQKIAHIERLQALAKRIEYWWRVREYPNTVSPGEVGWQNRLDRFLSDQMQQAGSDKERSAALFKISQRPESWNEVASAEISKLIDQDPVVGASKDFLERLWSDSAEDLLPYYDEAVAAEREEAESEDERVRALDTVEGMMEFFGPQYTRTRAGASAMLGQISQKFYGPAEAVGRSYNEMRGIKRDPLGLNQLLSTPVVIGGLILLTLIVPANMPVLMAVLATADVAASAYTLYYEVPNYLELKTAIENARRGRGVLGHDADAPLSEQQKIAALSIFFSALGVATSGRALTKAAAEARAAEIVRRTRAAFAVDASLATVPGVQRGAKRAAELGFPQSAIDTYLKHAETPTLATIKQRLRDQGFSEDLLEKAGEEVYKREFNRAGAFAEVLNSIGKLDEDIAAAIAAGVPRAEVDAMFKAALSTRSLQALGQRFPVDLMRASLNRQNITLVVDRAAPGVIRRNETRNLDDLPWEVFLDYWGGTAPARTIRADVDVLFDIRRKLSNMQSGFVESWSKSEQITLQHILNRDDLSSLHYLVEDEGVAFRLFDNDLIDIGQRFLKHPNRAAIANGRELLPPTTGVSMPTGAAPSNPSGLPRWMIAGPGATSAIERMERPGKDSVIADQELDPFATTAGRVVSTPASVGTAPVVPSLSEQHIADAAMTRARRSFGAGLAGWSTWVLADGSVAVTSPDQTRRVTASVAQGSDGQPRIDYQVESLRSEGGRAVLDQESILAGMFTSVSLETTGTTLPALPGPIRPVDITAATGSDSAGAAPSTNASATAPTPPSPSSVVPGTPATVGLISSVGTPVANNMLPPFTIFPGGRDVPNTFVDRGSAWSTVPPPSGFYTIYMNPPYVQTAIILPNGQVLLATTDGQQRTVAGNGSQNKEFDRDVLQPFAWTARNVVDAIARLVARPFVVHSSVRTPLGQTSPTGVADFRQTPGTRRPPVTVYLTALGTSTGEAFTLTALNNGPTPVTLNADDLVLEPVAGVTAQQVARDIANHRGPGKLTTTLTAYCLEFLKAPPAAGAVYRLANRAVGDKFSNYRHIMAATRRMQHFGLLPQDGGDPRTYFHSIRQWAIWAQEQRFDEKRFGDAFVTHTRKNAEQAGRQWTAAFEQAARGLVPGRWKAVQFVLEEADRFERSERLP